MIKVTESSEDPDEYRKVAERAEKSRRIVTEKVKKSGLPFSTWGVVVDGDKIKGMDVAD